MTTGTGSNALFRCFRLPQLDSDLSEPEVDAHGEPLRHRRSRGKSRTGCNKCKERRVKVCVQVFRNIVLSNHERVQCDEKRPPCWNCTGLGLYCGFRKCEAPRDPRPDSGYFPFIQCHPPDPLNRPGQILNTPSVLPPPLSNWVYPPISMSHMYLFHHFSNVTSEALVLGPSYGKRRLCHLLSR
jgi:hypothetical protein